MKSQKGPLIYIYNQVAVKDDADAAKLKGLLANTSTSWSYDTSSNIFHIDHLNRKDKKELKKAGYDVRRHMSLNL